MGIWAPPPPQCRDVSPWNGNSRPYDRHCWWSWSTIIWPAISCCFRWHWGFGGGGGRHDLYRLPMTCVCSVLRSKFGIGYFEELTHQSRPQKRFRDVGKWLVGSLFFWLPKTLIWFDGKVFWELDALDENQYKQRGNLTTRKKVTKKKVLYNNRATEQFHWNLLNIQLAPSRPGCRP